jgi:4-hydroxybenzoate polyprenyltransferase
MVRGTVINLGYFLQAKVAVLGDTLVTPPSSLSAIPAFLSQIATSYPEAVVVSMFFAVFGLVIALMKDVPDIKGDLKHKIPSFSVKLGPKIMFRYNSLVFS